MPNVLLLYGFDSNTTARYLEEAFRSLGAQVQTAGPTTDASASSSHLVSTSRTPDLSRLPSLSPEATNKVDLLVWIESPGLVDVRGLRHVGVPTVFWGIDSHLPGAWKRHAAIAARVSHSYLAQLAYVGPVSQGRSSVSWLPLACSPSVHHPISQAPDYDIVFFGNVLPTLHSQRAALLSRLESEGFSVLVAHGPREQISSA